MRTVAADQAKAQAKAEAELAGLRQAAARAERLLDWSDAARPQGPPPEAPAATAAPAKAKRRLWPFGRKPDPEAERRAAILAELQAAVDGRPSAVARARQQAPAADVVALRDRQRAAS